MFAWTEDLFCFLLFSIAATIHTMAFLATTMLEVLVFITWACLSVPVHKNGLFTQLSSRQTILFEICSAASLSFCPGLFDTIQAADPPAVSFFRNLPSDSHGRWGIYAPVLEKPGAVPLIYIGSGTDSKRGVPARWVAYDRLNVNMLPKYVLAALKNDYKIVHKGLLVWSPIPSAANYPRFRLLFVVMEAAFSFLFWAMKSEDKDYGMSTCCPWPRDSFSYRGLCSHNALLERISGNFDLSGEQLEAIAAEIKEKNRVYQANYHQLERALNPEGLEERQRKAEVRYRENSNDKVQAKQQRYQANSKASKKYYCTTCEISCSKPYEFARHNASSRHLRNVAKAGSGVVKKYRCDVCSYSCAKLSHLQSHNLGKRHLQRVAEAESRSST